MPTVEIDTSFLNTLLANPLVGLGLGLIVLIFLLVGMIFLLRNVLVYRGIISKGMSKIILHITVPKDTGDEQKASFSLQEIQEKIGNMETFFDNIAGQKAQKGFKHWLFGRTDTYSFEIVMHKGKIDFYVAAPREHQSYIEEQINAQFSHAFIEEVADYNLFKARGFVGGRILKFRKEKFFPIKRYDKFDSDPLNALTNALGKVSENDAAAIQIVVRSAKAEWRNKGIKVASLMQQGKKIKDAIKEAGGGGFGASIAKGVFKEATTIEKKPDDKDPYRLSPMEEEVVKGLEEKASKAGVSANVRIIAAAENQVKVDQYLNNITNAFTQYNIYEYGNAFKSQSVKLKKLIRNFIYRNINEEERMIFNTEELASLFHFPLPKINTAPAIRWLEARKAPAPINTPQEGVILGKNIYRGKETLVRIKDEDRVRHMYVIGMTGVGKSYLQSGLAMQDVAAGHGMCFIDPHGDDLEEILARVPKERAEDVIFFDPSDTERPIGLNMLEYETEEQKTFVVNEVMNIFDKLYDLRATGGPMFEQYFKNACYLIMDDPESGSTLMEISRVLADDDFRNYKLSKCKSQIVKDFWEKEALKAGGEASLQNMVPYITSKLTAFTANDLMRPIISQQKTTVDFFEAMNSGKIVLVKLAKGKIGNINANLLGMIIVGKILMAALARGDVPASERRDFYLFIDEFQNFLTDSIETILSEARKYRLALTIGHQYIGQLIKNGETKFKDAIFGNVGTKVAFRIGVDDAEQLTKEFAPTFGEYDFLNVPKFNCFVKLLIDNANPEPFNMSTIPHDELPVAPKNPELAQVIKQLSRLKYGKDREMVENEVKDRLKIQY